jgi:diguanylate cyclase (GGDEF)-like protein
VRADARERDGEQSGAHDDRAAALRDRKGAGSDRGQAAADRAAASVDREAAAEDRATSGIDDHPGAYRRHVGMAGLERDVARAKRTKQPFALVFFDVDGLKAMNDSRGHSAGDQLLRATVKSIRAHLRSYDVIIRFGGDEFLCGLADVTIADAATRFSLVNADLAAARQASVTVGVAELEPDDALEDLIAQTKPSTENASGCDPLALDRAADERPRCGSARAAPGLREVAVRSRRGKAQSDPDGHRRRDGWRVGARQDRSLGCASARMWRRDRKGAAGERYEKRLPVIDPATRELLDAGAAAAPFSCVRRDPVPRGRVARVA